MENKSLLDTIEPDILDRLADRKKEIDRGSPVRPGIAAMLAIGSVPLALAALTRDAYGAPPTGTIKAVLDFALALEIFENEFYKAVLNMSSSTTQNANFATVRAKVPAVALATLQQIQQHEQAHVNFLLNAGATNGGATGGTALNADSFDFTGNRGNGTAGPFAAATTDLPFLLAVAQGAEDTGVRAYKGQAANLMSDPPTLEAALRIHSVEARHASRIRRIRRGPGGGGDATIVRLSGTVRGGGAAAAGASGLNPSAAVAAVFGQIYGAGASSASAPSEDNTTQGGVPVASLSGVSSFGVEAVQEAFDEPLDKPDVVAIVQRFFIPALV
jgi:hypothetical protein